MKRLINTSTILSLALYVAPPFAAQAQDLKSVMVGGQQVMCLPNKQTACPDGAVCAMAIKAENCQANAEKVVAKLNAEKAKPGSDQSAADKAAADKAAADQAAAAKAAADKAAAEKAAADKAAADQAAAAKAAAEKAAAEKAAAKAAADQAAADKAAADKAAADKVATDKTASDQAAADKVAADKAAADKAAAATATPTAPVAGQAFPSVTVNGTNVICLPNKAAVCPDGATCVVAAKVPHCQVLAEKKLGEAVTKTDATTAPAPADQTAADQTAADKAAADKAAADKAAGTAPAATTAFPTVSVNGTTVICLPNKAAACPDGATCVIAAKVPHCQDLAEKKLSAETPKPDATPPTPEQTAAAKAAADKAAADQAAMDKANIEAAKKAQEAAAKAAAADPTVKVVEAPVADAQAVTTLQTVLDAPKGKDRTVQAQAVAAAAAAAGDLKAPPANQPPPKDAQVTTETVTAAETRTSAQEFAAAPVQLAPGKQTGLSDLEKVGLVALGALVIGAVINGNKQVVSNTGDRVVVRQDDGSYQLYKDDNSLLREPGAQVTTQTFPDGSTRTIVLRPDHSQITTIRDASGRVLQRVAYDRTGHATVLIDDLRPEQPVDFTRLPPPPPNNRISVDDNDAGMRAALATANAEDIGQKFSLRQIRDVPQVRHLAPMIDVPNVTFETGSAAIDPTEAQKLNKLGKFIVNLIAQNPGEVFLIEGHTDAVGSAASNLALSDRRAESVAKALTEYFQVPPENLVVQGYGESELLVNSGGDERANRRVAVRIITGLLYQTAK